jgi:hypothetical protein
MIVKIKINYPLDLSRNLVRVTTDDLLVTETQLTELLPVSNTTIRNWVASGSFTEAVYDYLPENAIKPRRLYRLRPALRLAKALLHRSAQRAEEKARQIAARVEGVQG